MFLRLAIRNLSRNRRRTVLTGLAIAVGLALMVVTASIQNGAYQQAIQSAIAQTAGNVVVQAKGYQDEREVSLLVQKSDQMASELKELFPDAVMARRIFLSGLIMSPANSVGAAVHGLEPEAERKIGEFHEKIVQGQWLDEDDRGIILGQTMAQSLGVDLSDKVVYMGQHGGGEMVSRLFRVKGIFRTGSAEMDGMFALITLGAAQDLLSAPGAAHQVTVHLPDARDSAAATVRARERLDDPELEVLSWSGALPELYALIQIDRGSADVMLAILAAIVAMGVLNTLLMSVLERTREFGVLLSIGLRRRFLVRLIVFEALALGVFGTLMGLVLGALGTWPLAVFGLDLTESMGESYEMAGVTTSAFLYASFDVQRVIGFSIGMILFTVLAALYPAWWLTRLKPVDAMRHH